NSDSLSSSEEELASLPLAEATKDVVGEDEAAVVEQPGESEFWLPGDRPWFRGVRGLLGRGRGQAVKPWSKTMAVGPGPDGQPLFRSLSRESGGNWSGKERAQAEEGKPSFLGGRSGNREGGTRMYWASQGDEKVLIKTERVVGHGSKQKLIEETKTIDGIKIVDIVGSLINIRSIVKDGKVIVQGTLHKQVFYIGTDGLEHHLAEDIEWSDLVDIVPINPANPVRPGMNQQDHSIIENLIFDLNPDTGQLTQKVIILLDVKVTETVELNVLLGTMGPYIKTQKVIGRGTKQKLIREEKTVPGIKIVEIVPSLVNVHSHVKNGKVILQGTLHKQIYYVGTDNIVHHLAEDIPWSDLVEVTGALEGMNEQDHSSVENLVFEFDPATGRLIQKVILKLDVVVTETAQIPVVIDPYGTLIKTPVVIGQGTKQKLIEETKPLEAIKIVDIVPSLRDITSVVKDGKVIVQGTLHKQVYYVGLDGLVHHVAEDIDWSELVEVPPLDPDVPVEEGMDQQDHSFIENLIFDFDPTTGLLTQKVIIGIDVVVTSTEQIYVADP
ncbi:MAG: DUF3794 domain-containing protein, partial [Firmicutes bacterium]|nr:DUF3794 domain-containing protein [Bacillota bacterium]